MHDGHLQPRGGGQLCEINVNECEPNPCLNGGTCTDRVNGFTCQCAAGWTGTNCGNPEVACPCNDPHVWTEFPAIVSGAVQVTRCLTGPNPDFGVEEGILVFASDDSGAMAGLLVGFGGGLGCSGFMDGGDVLTPAEAQVCTDLLEQAATRDGVTCTPVPN